MASSLKLIRKARSWLPFNSLIVGRLSQVRCFNEVPECKSPLSSDKNYSKSNLNPLKTVEVTFSSVTKGQNEEINKRIWTIPNGLCLFRILVSPLVAYTIINNQPVASAVICAVAGLTDFADGYIARRYENQRSTLGAILDPVADKILVSTLFLSTTISGQLPVLLTSIVIGRDLILITGAAYKRYQIMSQPYTLSHFFNLKGLNMEVRSSMISKWNTAFQFTLITATIAAPIINLSDSHILMYLQYLVATTTIASGVDYIFNRDKYISPLKWK